MFGGPLFYRQSPIPDHSRVMRTVVTTSTADEVVIDEVANATIVDLHTHLLPPSHGSLCLWGIDELLTYVSTFYIAHLGFSMSRQLKRIALHFVALPCGRVLYDGSTSSITRDVLCQIEAGSGRSRLESSIY